MEIQDMKPKKFSFCREFINGPDYYRDRAIQMGETLGAWTAELEILEQAEKQGRLTLSFQKTILNRKCQIYKARMIWYAKKYAETL